MHDEIHSIKLILTLTQKKWVRPTKNNLSHACSETMVQICLSVQDFTVRKPCISINVDQTFPSKSMTNGKSGSLVVCR